MKSDRSKRLWTDLSKATCRKAVPALVFVVSSKAHPVLARVQGEQQRATLVGGQLIEVQRSHGQYYRGRRDRTARYPAHWGVYEFQ